MHTRPVDVLPPDYDPHRHQRDEQTRIRKQRWLVFSAVTILVALIGLALVWMRPAVYQSQARLYFDYPSGTDTSVQDVAQQQLSLHRQRLLAADILTQVVEQQGNSLDIASLRQMLSVSLDVDARVLLLRATGSRSGELASIVQTWIDVFRSADQLQLDSDTQREIRRIDDQLEQLEQRLSDARGLMQAFGQQHNIVSLERTENRALNTVTGISKALDQARAEYAQFKGLLESVRQGIAQGQTIVRPADEARLSNLSDQIEVLEQELSDLSERFTDEYMALDPDIVAKQRSLQQLKNYKEEQRQLSQQQYLLELERQVTAADAKRQRLSDELNLLNKDAAAFSDILAEYQQRAELVDQLQVSRDQLRNQRLSLEVILPDVPQIDVLEAPQIADTPIAPDYWLDSLWVVVGALSCGFISLLLHWLVMGSGRPVSSGATHYTVVNPQQGPSALSLSGGEADPRLLADGGAPLSLPQAGTGVVPTPLSQTAVQQLYDGGNDRSKCIVGLLMCGASVDDLLGITVEQLDSEHNRVPLTDGRQLELPAPLMSVLKALTGAVTAGSGSIWPVHYNPEAVDQLLINLAHDHGIEQADSLTAQRLRLTYLASLMEKGCRLSDLELIAGAISAPLLAVCREQSRPAQALDWQQIDPIYPLKW
ncbi:hypothetical protein LJ739_11930 [Aestuariibacter halophilus]|uniref:Uncharacterized protein n=1 Tax=Fluctibacter halophilus TaxID=226011 RepID=A0ABS8GCN3_9ALTE|nr:hypothetical protein [Aestuariibacter halophilus]MCC2616951.1 hypothetical protein [Aestuariibacter halophilus]